MRNQKPREIAVQILKKWETSQGYLESIADEMLSAAALSGPDRRLVQELCYGVTRWRSTLDWLIARKTGNREQKAPLRWCLRLGLYQIFWLSRVPDHAIVFETVKMAKDLGCGPQAGFVNAILRGYLREEVETRRLLEELKASDPAKGWSHPDWLVERWVKAFGAEEAGRMFAWDNQTPRTYARVNTLRTTSETLLTRWQAEGVVAEPFASDWVGIGEVFALLEHPALHTLSTFAEGCFYIQDPSTLLAVQILDPKPGEAVLDLCAAPGGKTTLIAQRMNNQGRIVAQDTQPDRLNLLRDNCLRLGVSCVEISRSPEHVVPGLTAEFDRVILDAPCSNTGVMRRRVELRWRLNRAEIGRLCETQLDLLNRAAAQLKPGGTLVYSTCSLEPEENAMMVRKFLENRPEFELTAERGLIPFRDQVDGAYVARLVRKP